MIGLITKSSFLRECIIILSWVIINDGLLKFVDELSLFYSLLSCWFMFSEFLIGNLISLQVDYEADSNHLTEFVF